MSYKSIQLLILFLLLILNIGNFILFFIQFDNRLAYLILPIDKSFSLICHQQSSKLFNYFTFHTLLCSRCTGIYLGGITALISILIGIKLKISKLELFYTSIFLMLSDIIFYTSGIYNYSQWIALITGFLFGIAALNLLMISLQDLIKEINTENF